MTDVSLRTDRRTGPMRKAFETWIKRSWERSWRLMLERNEHGAYVHFDIQQSWFAFQAGWRRARR